MCKKLIILVFCASVLFSAVATAKVDDSGRLIVPGTSVAPIIDGELDDVWQNVGEEGVLITEIINTTSAVPDDLSDLSGTFKVMHDADNFYIYVVVQDSVIDYTFSDWQGDGVELFFDGDNSKGSSYDGVNDNQIRITVDDVELSNIDSSLPVDGSDFKVILTDVGYNIEASFPLEKLQIVPDNTFGFEVQINDNDDGSGRETMIRWFSNDNNSWQDASLFGTAVLTTEAEPEPVNPGTDGLVASYTLDGDVLDSSGNGHDGTTVGEPAFVEGQVGMALDFDGVDDLVELGKLDVVGQITLAAWIKPDDFEINDARIITKAQEWGGDDHWWMLSTISETSLRFRLKTDEGPTTATLISDPVLETGVFTHVAATWDGSTMRIYKDGVEVASQDKGGTAVAVDPEVSAAIGSQPSDAFASDPSHVVKFFDGLIDDVRIYSRALSEGELLYLAGARAIPVDPGTDGLMAYYPLDIDALDASGNGNDGTLNGDPQWVDGKIGGALEMDGGDFVDVPGAADINPESITLATWINFSTVDGADMERQDYLSRGDDYAFSLHEWGFRDGTEAEGKISAIVTSAGGWTVLSGSTLVEPETWYHTTLTYDTGSQMLKLYLDGEVEGKMDLPTGLEHRLGGSLTIGTYNGRDLLGKIDEVAIYNRALSGGEIRYLAGFRSETLTGLSDITMVDDAIASIRYKGTEYVVADGDLILGTTTRWYVLEGVETLWAEGDPTAPQTVGGSSNPKDGDVGSKADNFLFKLDGSTNISSIDGIDFQQTIFPSLVDTIIVFERNGNDVGSFQAIYADGSLGEPIEFVKSSDGGPYANTGIDVNGQNAYGVVFKTSVPVQGVRITASGHDTLSISAPAP